MNTMACGPPERFTQTADATVKDGLLVIEARKETVQNPNYTGSGDWKTTRKTAEYTSSSVTTSGHQSFQYGHFEMRARILGRFKMLMEDNFEDIVRCNTREHGKTLVESRGDVKRGMEVIEFALGVPSLMMGEVLENIARGIDCEAIRQPLGVCVGITPFNFPAMVPLWMYPIALACGTVTGTKGLRK